MRLIARIAPAALLLTIAACATTAERLPITDVPAGNYVMVEPASDTYQAVSITDRAYMMRAGDQLMGGEMWVDAAGDLHLLATDGPCLGQESLWRYDYEGRRITLDLVEDMCTARMNALPDRIVYERR